MGFNVEDLRVDPDKIKILSENKKCNLFVKGPIPVNWVAKANDLIPTALKIGLVLWHLVGLKKKFTVILTNQVLAKFNLNRQQKKVGLKALEGAGLIRVQRKEKANPIVTIIKNIG